MKIKSNLNQIIENEMISEDKMGTKRKTDKHYSERKKKLFNNFLKGIYNTFERMKEYGKYIRNQFIMPKEPELSPEPIPNQNPEKIEQNPETIEQNPERNSKVITYQRILFKKPKK